MNRAERRDAVKRGTPMLQPHKTVFLGYVRPRFPGLIHARWHDSLLALIAHSSGLFGIRPIAMESGPLLSRARNRLLEYFLEETTDEYFLWTDTDTIFNVEDLKALLDAQLPICGALYFTLDQDEQIVCAHLDEDSEDAGSYRDVKLERLLNPEGDGPAEPFVVSGLGMGFTLIKREVVESLAPIKKLWPYAETDVDKGYGEDLTFCLRAKEKGFDSWLVPAVKVGHIKEIVI